MKGLSVTRILALALVCFSAAAFAQEIGKEIPGDQQQTPPPDQAPNYDNPYATPPPPPPTPVKKSDEQGADGSAVPGPRKMAFGLRAGFGGGGIPGFSAAVGALAPAAPTIGFKLQVSESVGLNVDLGLLMGFVGSNTLLGFGLGFGIDAYMGRKDIPVRPFVTGGAAIGRPAARLDIGSDLLLAFNVGGGGEYWFNDHFSVNARALIGIPVAINNAGAIVTVATFMPGIGGTVYF